MSDPFRHYGGVPVLDMPARPGKSAATTPSCQPQSVQTSRSERWFGRVAPASTSEVRDESILLSKLATLLAVTGEPLFADFATLRFVQLYLYTHRVEELAPGVYRYWPEHAELEENQAAHISRQDDRWAKAELRDVNPDPERQYLVTEFASKALDSLPRPLKHTFILQKREGWTNRELAETPADDSGKRKISNPSGASKTALACSRSVENRISCG